MVRTGKSPVDGEGSFKKLNKQYANDEKQGNRTPNLTLEGDMLAEDSFKWKFTKDGIEIGVFKDNQVDKADGHNKHFSRKGNLPKRRFVPKKSQRYIKDIRDEIKDIIKENESEIVRDRRADAGTTTPSRPTQQEEARLPDEDTQGTGFEIDDFLSDDVITQLLRDEFRNGS